MSYSSPIHENCRVKTYPKTQNFSERFLRSEVLVFYPTRVWEGNRNLKNEKPMENRCFGNFGGFGFRNIGRFWTSTFFVYCDITFDMCTLPTESCTRPQQRAEHVTKNLPTGGSIFQFYLESDPETLFFRWNL